MIIRSVEPRAPAHLYWIIQVALLLILIGAMVIAGFALGSPHVIHSWLSIGRMGRSAPFPRDKPGAELYALRRQLSRDAARARSGPAARPV